MKNPFDPTTAPIDSLAAEHPLHSDRLNPEWLRNRFRQPAEWSPEFTDEHMLRDKQRVPVPASVLVPLVVREGHLSLLLTQRSAHCTQPLTQLLHHFCIGGLNATGFVVLQVSQCFKHET